MKAEKYSELLRNLLIKTESGEIRWRESADEDAFQVAFPHYSIILRKGSDDFFGNANFILYILNSEGREVDSISDNGFGEERGQVAELYLRARRQARSAEKAVDEILSALRNNR